MGSHAISSLSIRPPPQKVASRAIGRETSEVFEGPEGLEAKGVRKVSEQWPGCCAPGAVRDKREPPAALKKLVIKMLGVLFFT